MDRNEIHCSPVLHCHGLVQSFSAKYEEITSLSALEKGKSNGAVGALEFSLLLWSTEAHLDLLTH